jgi:hypothetical protein
MKKIALAGATLALVMAAGSAVAANSFATGTLGLNVPVVSSKALTNTAVEVPIISGKYFIAKDTAILGGFGFISGGPSGNSTTTFDMLVGVRKYMKTEDFAPFVGGVFMYESTSSSPSASAMTIAAEAGAEYFLAKQFSVEGKVSFGYISVDNGTTKSSYFGTSTAGLSVNYYF